MVRLLATVFIVASVQIHAQELASLIVSEESSTEPAPKSFFETRTLQDVQQMVHSDAQFINELGTDVSAPTPTPGNG